MRRFSLLGLGLVGITACASGTTPPTNPDPPAPPSAPVVTSDSTQDRTTPSATASPAANDAPDAGPTIDLTADVKGANAFTAHLFGKLRKQPGNLMMSGASLRHALAIADQGAKGDTEKELAAALGYPDDAAQVAALARGEDAVWEDARGKAELIVANRLWVDKASALNPDFAAGAQPVDFLKGADAARRTINGWVSDQTNQKIADLLPEGAVSARTKAVITNAIYFKGKWDTPFRATETKDEPFKGKQTANVPMMHRQGSYRFAQVGAAKALEMRYLGSQLAMLLVLPDDPAGLAKLEEGFSGDLDAWTKPLSLGRVNVTMPKVAFKWGAALSGPLGELGIKTAFTPKADFSGIGDGLAISQVFQKTWISIDEQGTEAAAASGMVMSTTSMQLGPVAEFKADHPFLFFVYDTKASRILFAGRVSDPSTGR